MYRRIATVGVTAAAIVGVGTAALAASGTGTSGSGSTAGGPGGGTSSSGAPAAGSTQQRHPAARRAGIAALRHAQHGSVVIRTAHGFVTRSGIRGTVTAVSPTAITVRAADGYSATYTLSSRTTVRRHTPGQHRPGTASSISALGTRDTVLVIGTAPDTRGAVPTATLVVDGVRA